MADAPETGSKMASKSSRWRTKIFTKDDVKPAEPKRTQSQADDDVNAFLRPSTEKAQQQQQRDAAAAFATAHRPRIDVARAQRWPGAQEVRSSVAACAKSPGPGCLRTGTRKTGLSVSFARAVPAIIGHGGDECDEPAAEVSRRKAAASGANAHSPMPLKPQDDANLSTTVGRTPSHTEQRNGLTRTMTSHGELSPPLDRRLEMGLINAHAQAAPPPPQRMGPMGLGDRPRPLSRAPTGFDSPQPGSIARNPSTASRDSDLSHDSDNAEPVLPRNMSNLEPTIHEEEDEPLPSDSLSARIKQRTRAEEGKTLHQARRDSDSSAQSSDPVQVATPPSSYRASPLSRRSPPPSHPARAMLPASLPFDTNESSVPQLEQAPTYRAMPPPLNDVGPPYQALPPPQVQPLSQAQDPGMPAISSGAQIPMRPRQDTHQQLQAPLGRSDSKTLGEAAFGDFAERVMHMMGIFALTAQLGGPLYDHTPMQWLRVATWWFLRGRAGMESMIRSRPKNESQPERLHQAHVDLAKVLWITTEVLPGHPSLQQYRGRAPDEQASAARQAGDNSTAEACEIQSAIVHYMKLLVGSMKKHQSMPPTQALIQGQDQSIWAAYPRFAPDAASVLQAGLPRSSDGPRNGAVQSTLGLSQYIPLCDTKADFCYFRMFVKASMSTDDPNTDRVSMAAVVSILRPKDQYQVKLCICSQDETINIVLGAGVDNGPTWDDVNWRKQSSSISINLRHGFVLTLELSESDWRSLYSIIDHTNRVQSDLREKRDERLACKLQLREVAYKDSASPGAFPPDRVQGCKLLVFEKFELSSEGTGKRKLHRGYRMALATHQQNRQVSLVNHELGTKQAPVNFEYVTEADNAPAMKLYFREDGHDKTARNCIAHLVFQEGKDRNHFFGTLTSMNIAQNEMTFAQVPLKSFQIESADQAEGYGSKSSRVLEKLQWQEAKVVNQDAQANGLEAAPTVMSESLRMVCRHSAGIIADRMNIGPGELLIRLPIDGSPELTLLRNAQQDLTIAIDGSRTERGTPDDLAQVLRTVAAASTIRRLTFNSFKDLHTFQFAVTGFQVKFDGIASAFSISRRRMVVPIYKQWTANRIRIQVVEQDNIVQLLAFFEDFSHADAMNFQLRVTDTCEITDKGGKFGLKLVDAKFALPVEERRGEGKMQKETGRLSGWAGTKRKFVCLDEIEYPGEHDDILIQFDSAETRDVFAGALPAGTVKRKFTVSRKI
ncbi:hypothetical protein ACEQ8H_005757 [Pleosporales sp. CAS-2024a]